MNSIIQLGRCSHCGAAAYLDRAQRCAECTADIERWIKEHGRREGAWQKIYELWHPIRTDIA